MSPVLRVVLLTVLAALPFGCGKVGIGRSQDSDTDLLTARKGFKTQVQRTVRYTPDGPADRPPPGTFEVVRYRSPAGALVAYLTPDPMDRQKHPAVVWAHGGFGGINGGEYWKRFPNPANDQSASAFREAGCVLMIPSWRGENDNPGMYEMFYGEVDDFLAARDYVASLPYVDPHRIYLAGHSTGGTITLLAATTGSENFRAAFSFGGAPDIGKVLEMGGYGNTPFSTWSSDEAYYRSATHFAGGIKRPTFYFEGCSDGYTTGYCPAADEMAAKAQKKGIPFKAFALPWGDHFSILHKATRMVAAKIKADTGAICNIDFTRQELQAR